MSMMLAHNRSSLLEIDMLNGETPEEARITNLMNGEYASYDLGVNYTVLAGGSTNFTSINPYQYVDVRMDWTKKYVNYTVGQNVTRSVHKKSSIPFEPLPLFFQHWSTGDVDFMGGPPNQRNEANVAWVRAFFNSSLDSKSDQKAFNTRCLAEPKCSVDDITLRGSSSYSPKALIRWKEPPAHEKWRLVAGVLCGGSSAIGIICLINVFFKRKPWKTMFNGEKRYEPAELDLGQGLTSKSPYVLAFKEDLKKDSFDSATSRKKSVSTTSSASIDPEEEDVVGDLDPKHNVRRRSVFKGQRSDSIPNQAVPKRPSVDVQEIGPAGASGGMFGNFSFGGDSKAPEVSVASYDFATQMPDVGTGVGTGRRKMSLFAQSRALSVVQDMESDEGLPVRDVRQRQSSVFQSVAMNVVRLGSVAPAIMEVPEEELTNEHLGEDHAVDIKEWNMQSQTDVPTIDPAFNAINPDRRPTIAEAVPIPSIDLPLRNAKAGERRVNYLAGLVAFSCLGVTGIHFTLTFVPYAGGLGGDWHYKSEYWARWTVQPFILDPMWLGPLFVTSCRFLVGGFFRKGDLKEIAVKMLLRAPRMLVPCLMVAMLEYFFLEQGLMAWLLWLPSVSWSSWAYITSYKNFAVFISDALEIAYLIPNAAPQIVSHYCVGVLWTVPVQLQFSYTALLAAVIIKDIKTTYKRFLIYFIAIATNWYALSWGSCFWAGVMLADLQVTYKMSTWLQAHRMVWYPLATFLWLLAIACPLMSLLEDRLHYPTMTREHNIHPDEESGKLIGDTARAGYPLYFEPRLNTLVFAVTIQMLVETSTTVQAFFSLRFWQPVFPHAYTVYLIHGFVFWSLGSYMAVKLAIVGLPYWANMLCTALCCYTCLALLTLALSPLTEMANAAACRNIQRWATVVPVPYRPTIAPFPHDLFLSRTSEGKADVEAAQASKPEEPEVEEMQTGDPDMKRKNTMVTISELESPTEECSSGPSSRGSSSR